MVLCRLTDANLAAARPAWTHYGQHCSPGDLPARADYRKWPRRHWLYHLQPEHQEPPIYF